VGKLLETLTAQADGLTVVLTATGMVCAAIFAIYKLRRDGPQEKITIMDPLPQQAPHPTSYQSLRQRIETDTLRANIYRGKNSPKKKGDVWGVLFLLVFAVIPPVVLVNFSIWVGQTAGNSDADVLNSDKLLFSLIFAVIMILFTYPGYTMLLRELARVFGRVTVYANPAIVIIELEFAGFHDNQNILREFARYDGSSFVRRSDGLKVFTLPIPAYVRRELSQYLSTNWD
jgi:hypothetical protein